jgi:hypothetical protein
MHPLDQEQAVRQYAELARLISVGAYDELEPDGSYREGGDNVLRDIDRLEWRAARSGLKFVKGESGAYTLLPMTEEEQRAYLEALMFASERSADDFISGRKRSKAVDEWLENFDDEDDDSEELYESGGSSGNLHQCPYCDDLGSSEHEEFCRLNPHRNRNIVP